MTLGRSIALIEEMAVAQALKMARTMPVNLTPRPSSSHEIPDMETTMSNLSSSLPPAPASLPPASLPPAPVPAPALPAQIEERVIEPRVADLVQDQAAANPTRASLERMRRALQ